MKHIITMLLASSFLLGNSAIASKKDALGWGLVTPGKAAQIEKAKVKKSVGLFMTKKAKKKPVAGWLAGKKSKPTVIGFIK